MYTFSDKQSRNSHSNRASKPFESKRWDHGGFDQLQTEQKSRFKNEDKGDKLKKQRRFPDDTTMASDTLKDQEQSSRQGATLDKWTHDKYDEISNQNKDEPKIQVGNGTHENGKPEKSGRRERKPDRKLYSVRDKRGQEEPKVIPQKEQKIEGADTQEKEKSVAKSEEVIKAQKGSEKEIHINEDDTISNVSTAISDPLKGFEEENSIIKESQNISAKKALEKAKDRKKEEEEPLFEIVLETDKKEIVKIFDSESDYEIFLDGLCERSGLGKRMSLYFKIDIVQMIQEVHPDPKKLDGLLDKLLDLNYKIISADEEGVIDESILPYLAEEEEILDDEMDPEINKMDEQEEQEQEEVY